MRIVDIFNCVPTMPMLMIVGVALDAQDVTGPAKLYILMAMMTLFGWAGTARLVRGQILSLREQDFMLSAEASGLPASRKIFKHLIPNVMPQLIVSMTLGLGGIILTEATLGYLGIGLPAEYATWGNMINAAGKQHCAPFVSEFVDFTRYLHSTCSACVQLRRRRFARRVRPEGKEIMLCLKRKKKLRIRTSII